MSLWSYVFMSLKLSKRTSEAPKHIEELKSKNGLIQKRSFFLQKKYKKTDTTLSIVSVAIECLNVITLIVNCYESNDINRMSEMTLHCYFFFMFGISSRAAAAIAKVVELNNNNNVFFLFIKLPSYIKNFNHYTKSEKEISKHDVR